MEWGLRTMIGLLGYNFFLDGNCLDPMPTSTNEITSTKLQNGIFSHFNTSKDVTGNYSYVVPTEWDFDTIMDANFENNIGAGTLSEITKDITSIRIKRREKGTFDWVTIKEVPISGIDDFSFVFTDNLASNFTQYEYAYVPVIEQTEGNYTIEEVYSKFKGVFICDVNTIYKFYADIEYGSTDSVQKIGTYEPSTLKSISFPSMYIGFSGLDLPSIARTCDSIVMFPSSQLLVKYKLPYSTTDSNLINISIMPVSSNVPFTVAPVACILYVVLSSKPLNV